MRFEQIPRDPEGNLEIRNMDIHHADSLEQAATNLTGANDEVVYQKDDKGKLEALYFSIREGRHYLIREAKIYDYPSLFSALHKDPVQVHMVPRTSGLSNEEFEDGFVKYPIKE